MARLFTLRNLRIAQLYRILMTVALTACIGWVGFFLDFTAASADTQPTFAQFQVIRERKMEAVTANLTTVLPTNQTSAPNSTEITHGVPSNPTNVLAVADDGRAQVSWTKPEDDGSDMITKYEIATFLADGETPEHGNVIISSSDNNSPAQTFAIIGNLKNGLSYSFKVRAANINGYSTWSARSSQVRPIHPPDLCTHVTCSGHGTCFPNYDETKDENKATANHGATCICRPGYLVPGCSRKDPKIEYQWTASEWSVCSAGCGGGQKTRKVKCTHIETGKEVTEPNACETKSFTSVRMCNNIACGSNLAEVHYEIDMNYDEVMFSLESQTQFEDAFLHEMASALNVPASRFTISSIFKGSIWVRFLILPPTKENEKTLDEVIESLQKQIADDSSLLRTQGTFVRRIKPSTMKLSFFIADRISAGDAEISVGSLIGTVLVLVGFISAFGYFLRRRHERIMATRRSRTGSAGGSRGAELKPMGIQTMT